MTGNVSGSSGSCTGNAATATTAVALSGGTVTTGTNSISTSSGTLTVPNLLSDGTNTIYKYIPLANIIAYGTSTSGGILIGSASASPVNIGTSGNINLGYSITAPTINTGSGGSGGTINAATVNANLTGNVTGNVSGFSGSCTGNASTATTSVDLSGGTVTTGTNSISTSSGTLTVPTLSDGTNTIYTHITSPNVLGFGTSTSGIINIGSASASLVNIGTSGNINLGNTITAPTINTGLSRSGGTINAATVNANLTGNVTGNVSGSSGSCTGNAATATTATNFNNGTSSSSGGTITATTLSYGGGNFCTLFSGVIPTFGNTSIPTRYLGYKINLGDNSGYLIQNNYYQTFSGVTSISIPFNTSAAARSGTDLSASNPVCRIQFAATGSSDPCNFLIGDTSVAGVSQLVYSSSSSSSAVMIPAFSTSKAYLFGIFQNFVSPYYCYGPGGVTSTIDLQYTGGTFPIDGNPQVNVSCNSVAIVSGYNYGVQTTAFCMSTSKTLTIYCQTTSGAAINMTGSYTVTYI